MQYVHPLKKPFHCDICGIVVQDELLRNINFYSNNGRLNYFLCAHCMDQLSDNLEDKELIMCAECSQEIRWFNDKCMCGR